MICSCPLVWAQGDLPRLESPTAEEESPAPVQVSIEPMAQDEQIAERLTRILRATEWFVEPAVTVRDGVVFLKGRASSERQREWGGNLARNTQDVVAVVNRIEVISRPVWDFSPAWSELRVLWRAAVQAIPMLVFAVVVLLLTWWLARFVAQYAQVFFRSRVRSALLATITARIMVIPVFLLGIYLVLQVAGLTRLALTVLGGTSILGIIVGFAFRDIAENFLASILLSIRQPFRRNDLIEVLEQIGVVQQMNTRSTVLMTLDGNHVQIPNALIYKNVITNFSSNPNCRSDFLLGIGYENTVPQAQQLVLKVLDQHPMVLRTPEPLVLVDQLAASTINLRVYFWYNAVQYAPIKIRSSLLRLINRALQDAGISMPDDAREVIFPKGVPIVQMPRAASIQQLEEGAAGASSQMAGHKAKQEPVTSEAEGALKSSEEEIFDQAQKSRIPEDGEDLLAGK